MPCYNSCKHCSGYGIVNNQKCISCKPGYEFKNDFENDNNCYKICENYYYFDSDKKYYCTQEKKKCPDEYIS